jgi:hypothetical protein
LSPAFQDRIQSREFLGFPDPNLCLTLFVRIRLWL